MLSVPHPVRILLHSEAVDLRKSFDGLSGLVSQAFPRENLLSGHLFLFLNKRRDRIKILHWDADGLVIWYKKQEPDCTHPPAFTGIARAGDNFGNRPDSARRMDGSSSPIASGRSAMSRGSAAIAPPRTRPSSGQWCPASSGTC